MTTLFTLNTIAKNYPWGSLHGIESYTGQIDPDGKPVAELWMSAYPGAAAGVHVPGSGTIPLDEAITANPELFLGTQCLEEFGAELPFLFKLLSADSPLSLQVHPNREQANRGFSRESARGIAVQAASRNYRDRHAKDELIMALTPFTALCGFREPLEAVSLLELCGNRIPPAATDILRSGGSWIRFLSFLLSLDADTQRRTALSICEGISSGSIAPRGDEEHLVLDLVIECSRTHPGDIGILAPLYLNTFFLEPGEALFLPSGIMHAYIRGTGLELMTNSDNLLRCGLTPKHIDIPEMLSILDPVPAKPLIIKDDRSHGLFRYRTPIREFELLTVAPHMTEVSIELNGPAVIFGEDGRISIQPRNGDPLEISRGKAILAAAAAESLSFSGSGRVYIATVADKALVSKDTVVHAESRGNKR